MKTFSRSFFDRLLDNPCKCGWLENQSSEPDSPIEWDPKLKEYHIMMKPKGADSGRLMIYYCPFCGGKAPKSLRETLYHKVTNSEIRRLEKVISNLKTLDDVINQLGEPDSESKGGTCYPAKNGKPEYYESYRILSYHSLSKTVDVDVKVFSDNTVGFNFSGRYKENEQNNQATADDT